MNFSKKVYGLILPKKSSEQKPVVNKASVFGNDSDSDEDRPLPKLQRNESKKVFMKKQVQMDLEKALQEDPNAFAYDEVYDQVQAKKIEKEAAEKANVDRKPKFIGSLLKAADLRKKEDERRLERTIQREREAEKGQYDDKDAFVTESFRKKMREMKEEEERERKKLELEEQNDVTKTGDYSGFYRNMLNKKFGQSESADGKVKEEPEEKKSEERQKNTKVRVEIDSDQDQGLRSRRPSEKYDRHGREKHRDKKAEVGGGQNERSYRSHNRRDEKNGDRRRERSESDNDNVEKRKSHKKKIDVVESKVCEKERTLVARTQKDERRKRRRSFSSESDDGRTCKEGQKNRQRTSVANSGNKSQQEERLRHRRSSDSEREEIGKEKREGEKKRRNSSSSTDGKDDKGRHSKKKESADTCLPLQLHTGDTDDTNDSSSSSEDDEHKDAASSQNELHKGKDIASEKPLPLATTTFKERFAKKNDGVVFNDAQARYLARKNAVTAAVAKE